jgi:hypothetical protein
MPATIPLFLGAFIFLALAGCTSSYQVVEVPQYGADLYPTSQTRSGVTIAIDGIRSRDRAKRYFGSDVIREGIFPVNVVVSNYSKQRVALKPSDIVLYRWNEILDPMPIEMVVASAKRQHGAMAVSAEAPVGKFFVSSAFHETVLAPNESYAGVVFFSLPPASSKRFDEWFRTYSVYGTSVPKIRVGVTNLDAGERVLFGPFVIALPEE